MFDIIIFSLLCAIAFCSIIELGLSAYLVSILNDYYNYRYSGIGARFNYSVFCSVWTLLIVGFLLVWAFTRSGRDSERWLGPLTLALNTVTMIFWLACFASLADLYDGFNPTGTPGAQLAFAVIIWILFVALVILNFLTAFGVIKSERAGHSKFIGATRFDANRGPTTAPATTTV